MGLDMYILKFKKLKEQDREKLSKPGMTCEEINKLGYNCHIVTDTEDYELIRRPYEAGFMHKMTAIASKIDLPSIMEDHNIPKHARIAGYMTGNDTYSFTFKWKRQRECKSECVTVPFSEIQKKYVKQTPQDVYVALEEMADYWRKSYSLQDYIYKKLDNKVQNLGYYPLSEENIKDIYNFIDHNVNGEPIGVKRPSYDPKTEILAYHEWY